MSYNPESLKSLDLQSKRLLYRFPDLDLLESIRDYHVRNRDFFKPWNPRVRPVFYEVDFQRDKIQSEWQLHLEKRMLKFWLFKRSDLRCQNVIGHVAYSNIVWGGFRSCFLGYSIDQDHNGQGYATEALAYTVNFVFKTLHLHRIEANIMPRNRGSIRVVEKLGFDCEGLSPKYLKINGAWEDHLHYVVRNQALE